MKLPFKKRSAEAGDTEESDKKQKKQKKEKKPKKEKVKKEKPKKEKKEKPKKEKPKKGEKTSKGADTTGKKGGKKKLLLPLILLLLIGAAAAVYFVVLPKLGNNSEEVPSEPPTPPEVYQVGENIAPPFDHYFGKAMGLLIQIEEPTEEDPNHYIYHYQDLLKPLDTITTYYEQMTTDANQFVVIDDTLLVQEESPNLDTSTGELILARKGTESGTVFRMILDWNEDNTCTIDVATVSGKLQYPKEEQSSMGGSSNPATLSEQIEHMKSYTPAQLGLEGDDLQAFRIFPIEGIMSVDNQSCRQFNVYQLSEPEQTNHIVGSYLLTLDLQHLYRLDTETNTVTKLH